jgi:chromosome segregation ATPase
MEIELMKKNDELKVHIEELETIKREHQEKTIEIDQIKRDLRVRLDQLDEKSLMICQLKNELENQQTQFTSVITNFGTVKHEADTKTMETEKLREALRIRHATLDQLKMELSEKEMECELKTKEIASLVEELKKNQGNIKKQQDEWSESQLERKDGSLNILNDAQPIIQNEKKSIAGDIDHIIKNGEEHLGQLHEDITWKEKLRICNEIEKCLDHTADDHLKTKKLKDEESK